MNVVDYRSRHNQRYQNKGDDSRDIQKRCYRCNSPSHFAPQCPKRKLNSGRESQGQSRSHRGKCKHRGKKQTGTENLNGKVNAVTNQTHRDSSSDDEYVSVVCSESQATGNLTVEIADIPVNVLIDSGATVNVVNSETWKCIAKTGVSLRTNQ